MSEMPRKIVLLGNSGSGKSTLAKRLVGEAHLAHLDLDTVAWLPTEPPQRQSLSVSIERIDQFMQHNTRWIIEGCYTDLLSHAAKSANELIYLDVPTEQCVANALARPWESHKYSSAEEQNRNLPMLLEWIRQYPHRTDTFSQAAHNGLFECFTGKKTRVSRQADSV
ncbi:AAA family ATPase [Alteromonas oceanisediminis]|uniref:AAA family ATPase n=1 Tax=Alteromonas oceanisediminis TaxID=2836180 RepID=UPI001BD9EBE6|nr:AAA family ATPase [Alteromonas oceanisediminis]MBT0586523.1 AAA family ATPase [Alteromonas oceanisediminis]